MNDFVDMFGFVRMHVSLNNQALYDVEGKIVQEYISLYLKVISQYLFIVFICR